MKSTDILAFSVFAAVIMIGAVALVDATEAGLVISDVEAPVIGGVFATLAAASIGVVVGNRLLGNRGKGRSDDTPDDPDDPEDPERL
jgi:hypothetical protein